MTHVDCLCSSSVGIARSSASSAVATPGRETITDAIEVAATSRRNSALDDVCAESFVVVIEDVDDVTTKASDEAKREETRNNMQEVFMIR